MINYEELSLDCFDAGEGRGSTCVMYWADNRRYNGGCRVYCLLTRRINGEGCGGAERQTIACSKVVYSHSVPCYADRRPSSQCPAEGWTAAACWLVCW